MSIKDHSKVNQHLTADAFTLLHMGWITINPKHLEILDGMLMARLIFVSPNRNFLRKTKVDKIPKQNFQMENVRSIC